MVVNTTKIMKIALVLLFGVFVLMSDLQIQQRTMISAVRTRYSDVFGGRLITVPHRLVISGRGYRRWVSALNYAACKTHISYVKREYTPTYRFSHGHLDYAHEGANINYSLSGPKHSTFFGKNSLRVIGNYKFKYSRRNVEKDANHEADWLVLCKQNKQYTTFTNLATRYLQQHGWRILNRNIRAKQMFSGRELDVENTLELTVIKIIVLVSLLLMLLIMQVVSIGDYSILRVNGFSWVRAASIQNRLIIYWGVGIASALFIYFAIGGFGILNIMLETLLTLAILGAALMFSTREIINTDVSLITKNQIFSTGLVAVSELVKMSCIVISTLYIIPVLMMHFSRTPAVMGPRASQFATLYPYAQGRNSELHSMADSEYLDRHLFNRLTNLGGVFYDDSDLKQPIPHTSTEIRVSYNYLHDFAIKTITGNKIQVAKNTHKLVLILPQRELKNQTVFVRKLEADQRDKRAGYAVYYVANTSTIYSLSKFHFVPVEPMLVTTPNNSSFTDRNIINGQEFSDGMKFDLQGTTKAKLYRRVHQLLGRFQMGDNYIQLVPFNEVYREDNDMAAGRVTIKLITACSLR